MISASLKSDKDVVMAAVTNDGSALEYADASLKSDKDVVMAAVTQKNPMLALEICK
jgi:beta-glucosidase-like glycosyl hydrolase